MNLEDRKKELEESFKQLTEKLRGINLAIEQTRGAHAEIQRLINEEAKDEAPEAVDSQAVNAE